MKTNLLLSTVKSNPILSSAIAAGALGLFYMIRRMRSGKAVPETLTQAADRPRHLTKFFSKAKSMA